MSGQSDANKGEHHWRMDDPRPGQVPHYHGRKFCCSSQSHPGRSEVYSGRSGLEPEYQSWICILKNPRPNEVP
ncbi:hypothetical protein ANN_06699 [Periplaneta americana]|uniref:Uncharacterized protein n=1 Tax=Periplaneta americana TaxID=6978 RepID=A0ABQ8TFY4_PERAM|nr:hypothetical protein ANN_06699 [Periplaneta americana]